MYTIHTQTVQVHTNKQTNYASESIYTPKLFRDTLVILENVLSRLLGVRDKVAGKYVLTSKPIALKIVQGTGQHAKST